MNDRIKESNEERDRQVGALNFFESHPNLRISRCDANVSLLSANIPVERLADPAAWEEAYNKVGNSLAPLQPKAPASEDKPQPEPWTWPFPQFKSVGDVKRCPGDIYRQWYFDKTNKGEKFREMVNNILDAANAKRGF